MRIVPDGRMAEWLTGQPRRQLYATAIGRAEIYYGIAMRPEGKKKAALAHAASAVFKGTFGGRILSFDDEAAMFFAEIAAWRRRSGKAISGVDAQIAAIAGAQGAAIATRNTSHFEDCGVPVINPWHAQVIS